MVFLAFFWLMIMQRVGKSDASAPNATNKKSLFPEGKRLLLYGSPGGTRTPDKAVNSRLLYQLSYRGMVLVAKRAHGLQPWPFRDWLISTESPGRQEKVAGCSVLLGGLEAEVRWLAEGVSATGRQFNFGY